MRDTDTDTVLRTAVPEGARSMKRRTNIERTLLDPEAGGDCLQFGGEVSEFGRG